MSFTLAQMKSKARQRSDQENSTLVSDAELNGYVNASYAELYDILTAKFEDYYIKDPVSFTLSGSSYTSTLPSDFYKLRGLDYQLSTGKFKELKKFNFEERNVGSDPIFSFDGYIRKYRILGQKITVMPQDQAAGTYQLWYVPRYTPLVLDTDTLGDVLDFEEYIVVDVAIKMLIKEESDVQELMLIKQQLKERIEAMSANRDVTPDKISRTARPRY